MAADPIIYHPRPGVAVMYSSGSERGLAERPLFVGSEEPNIGTPGVSSGWYGTTTPGYPLTIKESRFPDAKHPLLNQGAGWLKGFDLDTFEVRSDIQNEGFPTKNSILLELREISRRIVTGDTSLRHLLHNQRRKQGKFWACDQGDLVILEVGVDRRTVPALVLSSKFAHQTVPDVDFLLVAPVVTVPASEDDLTFRTQDHEGKERKFEVVWDMPLTVNSLEHGTGNLRLEFCERRTRVLDNSQRIVLQRRLGELMGWEKVDMGDAENRKRRRTLRSRQERAQRVLPEYGLLQRASRAVAQAQEEEFARRAAESVVGPVERLRSWFMSLGESLSVLTSQAAVTVRADAEPGLILSDEGLEGRAIVNLCVRPGMPLRWTMKNTTGAPLWLVFVESGFDGVLSVLPERRLEDAVQVEAGENFVLEFAADGKVGTGQILAVGLSRPPSGPSTRLLGGEEAWRDLSVVAVTSLEVELRSE